MSSENFDDIQGSIEDDLLDLDAFDLDVHIDDRQSAFYDEAVADAFDDFDDAPTVASDVRRGRALFPLELSCPRTSCLLHIRVCLRLSVSAARSLRQDQARLCLACPGSLCVAVCGVHLAHDSRNLQVASNPTSDGQAHNHAVMTGEMLRLCQQLDPEGDEQQQCEICGSLEHLLRQDGQLKHALMLHHQVPRPTVSFMHAPAPASPAPTPVLAHELDVVAR